MPDEEQPQLFQDLPAVTPAPHTARRDLAPEERAVGERPQTELKLRFLRHYLERWFVVLGMKPTVRELWLLDVFAGPGRYPLTHGGPAVVDGSPRIAAEAAKAARAILKTRGRAPTIRLRFVEPNADTRVRLTDALAEYREDLDIAIIPGAAADHLGGLLASSLGHPTFVFFDPDGYRDVSFDLVQACARPGTEVLISFDVQAAALRAAALDAASLTRFMGGDWRHLRGEDGTIPPDAFVAAYRARVGSVFAHANAHHVVYKQSHANRAIVQGCWSVVGLEEWRKALARARKDMAPGEVLEILVVDDERARVDRIVSSLTSFHGRTGVAYRELVVALGALDYDNIAMRDALLFMQESGAVHWTGTLTKNGGPRFTFAGNIPPLKWDGRHRRDARWTA